MVFFFSPEICLMLRDLMQLQQLAGQLIDLWNLMETSEEERQIFHHITCHVSASVDEVTAPGALAVDIIEQVHGFLYLP